MTRARVFLLLSGLLLVTPLVMRAQTTDIPATNAPSAVISTPLDTTTNAPAVNVPSSVLDTPVPGQIQPQTVAPTAQAPTQKAEEIDDIRPPFFFIHSWLWLWLTLGGIALVALLIAIFFWLRPAPQLSAKSAYDLTLEKLEKARALLQEENPMPYAVAVSEAIRSYLGQRFLTPSTRRTTEEFLKLMENNPTVQLAEHRDLLRHFLESCDMVKFARYQPTFAELEEVQQRAYNFVTATKPLPAEQNGRRA